MTRKIFIAFTVIALAAIWSPHANAGWDLMLTNWDTDQADDTFGGGLTYTFGQGWIGGEARVSYLEELNAEPVESFFDADSPFEAGLEVLPIDLGARFDLDRSPGGKFHPYASLGVSYFMLDSDFGSVDDEVGTYAGLGGRWGDGDGIGFVTEISHRWATGTVRDLGDLDDDGFDDEPDIDLDGFAFNVGITLRW